MHLFGCKCIQEIATKEMHTATKEMHTAPCGMQGETMVCIFGCKCSELEQFNSRAHHSTRAFDLFHGNHTTTVKKQGETAVCTFRCKGSELELFASF